MERYLFCYYTEINDECKDLGKDKLNYEGNDFIITRSFEESLKEAKKHIYDNNEVFIIGGSRLYNEALK